MPLAALCARRRGRRAAAVIGALVAYFGTSWGQTIDRPEPPPGIPAGPFVIAPSLLAGYAYDSNIFFRSDDVGLDPVPDQVATAVPALAIMLPFGHSQFLFKDTLTWFDYKETPQTSGKTSNDAYAELDLVFRTFDTLRLTAQHIAGVAETIAFDPGGEATFEGNAYRLHAESMSLAREIDGRRGYRLRLARNVVAFDPSENANFFDYSGFDGEAAFLQPLSSNTRISFGYVGTRYDHFNVNVNPYIVARTEAGDTVFGTIEGRLGPRQPYQVRLGWERLAFAGPEAEGGNYSGLILQAGASFILGGGTVLSVSAQRQPFRSFFIGNNYYVFNAVSVSGTRTFPRGSTFGAILSLVRSAYAAPVPPGFLAEGTMRVDKAIVAEGYANLAIRERVAFRISIRKNVKASTYPGAEYDNLNVFGGFVLGWF